MKLSLSWIRDINKRYACSADPAPDGVEKLVEKIGTQLGAVDEVIDLGKRYEGIVVVKVVSVEKHPNADKLTICFIDDGGVVKGLKRVSWPQDTRASTVSGRGRAAEGTVQRSTESEQRSPEAENVPQPSGAAGSAGRQAGRSRGLVQVVCGAPNVKPTLQVAWIPPGVAVPATYSKEPLILKTREIRGVASNGMLASPKELAIGDSHEGLLIIDEPVKPGTPFAKVYDLDDCIIDIENKMFTHRPDLFGQLGLARELAGIQGHVFKSPAWYRHDAKLPKGNSRNTHPLKVKNEVPKLVPRFVAVVMKDIKVQPSPVWLQARLASVGLRSINNIVDLTNFFMLETAQPLHAYDYDKVASDQAVLGVRLAKRAEELTLLGGKKIKLGGEEIVITDGQQPIGLGGVMGGAGTEVDENTKTIILECAAFDMNATRRSAMAHGLFSDAATRFTKGQSPLQNTPVAAKAVEDIMRIAGGRVVLAHDNNHVPAEAIRRGNLHPPVEVSAGFINSRLGLQLTAAQIIKLLSNVEFRVSRSGDKLEVTAPFWRTDIAIAEDVVEEVGRLYGYDHLPPELPLHDLTPVKSDTLLSFKTHLREILSAAGVNEILTYSFVDESLLRSVGQNPADAYHIRNALSPNLQYYRLSLVPSLLERVHPNIKAGFNEFAFFEIGKGHKKNLLDKEKLPKELERLSVVIASKKPKAGSAYYEAKKISDFILSRLGVGGIGYQALSPSAEMRTEPYYEPSRAANITLQDRVIGRIGEFKPSVKKALKLPNYCAGFQLYTEELMEAASSTEYQPLSRFPLLEQDICLRTSAEASYAELTKFVEDFLESSAQRLGYGYQLQPLDIFKRPGDNNRKQTTWRISLWHPMRTLTTDETNALLDELAKEAKARLKAERI